jgi:glycosyltransferase involved in cell wall biosynthesis
MQIAVFHPGTQHSWQTALALQQLNRLAWYATSIFHQPERWPYRLERYLPGPLAERVSAEFRRFSHPGLDPALVRTGGLAEWAERIAARGGWRGLAQRIDAVGNRRFAKVIAAAIAGPQPFALWGYNGSSRTGFALAKAQGRACILDRTIGDARAYNAAMAGLQERYGDWFLPEERAIPAANIASDDAEYALADAILCGSEFAAASVRSFAPDHAAKVRVLPYCYDERLFADQPAPEPVPRTGPLEFLFVGQINPRKGTHHLLEAFAAIPESVARLTLVGDLRIPRAQFARYADRVRHVPQVPRSAVPGIMAAHHVLVFPSYFEGSALTLLEALASGLGIIQTRASGNGATPATGIVLEHPDTEALREAILTAVADRDRVDRWRGAAQAAARNYTFARYRDAIAAFLHEAKL